MTPERWSKVEHLFQVAVARPVEERAAFLDETCAGDESIRREVEALLASDRAEDTALEEIASGLAAEWAAATGGHELIGKTLGRYHILQPLGSGGMGEVYLAQDTKLDRKVALKFLPRKFTRDRDRLRRFEQEARAASALNHPHIVTIYETGEWEGEHFIATEYIEGRTLRDQLEQPRLPLSDVLDIGCQAAGALAAAHAAGIVHRDVKPANIMLRTDGYIKVLDFGLAKLTKANTALDVTEPGRVMGTINYMSPEQALGKPLDHRTDIFSLGVVLYEIATGHRLFTGETEAETYDCILHLEPPPMREFDPTLPLAFDQVIRRALQKDPARRYQSAADLRADLRRLAQGSSSTAAAQEEPAGGFFAELKRRNVYKVAVAYAVVAWLVVQVATQTFPFLEIETWAVRLVILLAIIGFPIALVLGWAFELTSEGIQLAQAARRTPRKKLAPHGWIYFALTAAALSVALFFTGRYTAPAPHSRPAATMEKSIAVLPFVDLSQAKDQEYLCDGISEELLGSLAKVEGLRVAARSSSFSFKGKTESVREIAQKLGVEQILEGTVRRDGDKIRLSAQLVSARDGMNLWSGTFDREMAGVFAVQDEITRAIVEKLKVKLALEAPARAPASAEAHDLYLRGLYFSNKTGEPELRKALAYFRQALDLDPNLSSAWAGVSKVWTWLADEYVQPIEGYRAAEAAARQALALNPNEAEARANLATSLWVLNWDLKAGEEEMARALAIDPNLTTARFIRSLLRCYRGDFDGALQDVAAGERSDPLNPAIPNVKTNVLMWQGRFDEARAAAQHTINLEPTWAYAGSPLARVYLQQGKFKEALEIYTPASGPPPRPGMELAVAYAGLGREAEAREVLRQLIEQRRQKYFGADAVARVYAALGDHEQALRWLETAYEERSANLPNGAFHTQFFPLHSDPRFRELMRKIGLDPAVVLDRKVSQPAAPNETSRKSIAVLPFADLSQAKDQEYFSDGMAEEIRNALAQVKDLKVAGRSSSFSFKGKSEDLRAIGAALGVAHLLEGSVRRQGEKMRITAQLIEASDGFQLWSKSYEGELSDVFQLQERIARAITDQLEVAVLGEQKSRLVKAPTSNTEAYSLYLKATAIFNRRESARFPEAISQLQEAVRLDPKFARAHARAALIHSLAPVYDARLRDSSAEATVREVRRAQELDPTLAEPGAALGQMLLNQRHFGEAWASYEQALALDPEDINTSFWLAIAKNSHGYLKVSAEELDKVLAKDPMFPNALYWRGRAYQQMGDVDQAERLLRRGADAGLPHVGLVLSEVEQARGRKAEATDWLARGMETFLRDFPAGSARIIAEGVYGNDAEREKAIALIDRYLAGQPPVVSGAAPFALIRLGQPARGLALAQDKPLSNDAFIFPFLWGPLGRSARVLPEFSEFARRSGLAALWDVRGPPDQCRKNDKGDYVCE